MKSQVTTKRGDLGETVTIAGDCLSKSHPIFECCGKVDTLRAHTASCRLAITESGRPDADDLTSILYWLLHTYFLIGAQCNDPLDKHPEYRKGEIAPKHLEILEGHQAVIESKLDLPNAFIVGASSRSAAEADLVCTAARDLERSVVRLKELEPAFQVEHMLRFLNRLSDFLFVLARHLENGQHLTVDYDLVGEEE
jgi:cob(I)alamin adenosyltransferase